MCFVLFTTQSSYVNNTILSYSLLSSWIGNNTNVAYVSYIGSYDNSRKLYVKLVQYRTGYGYMCMLCVNLSACQATAYINSTFQTLITINDSNATITTTAPVTSAKASITTSTILVTLTIMDSESSNISTTATTTTLITIMDTRAVVNCTSYTYMPYMFMMCGPASEEYSFENATEQCNSNGYEIAELFVSNNITTPRYFPCY
jgi:hypothetical protein